MYRDIYQCLTWAFKLWTSSEMWKVCIVISKAFSPFSPYLAILVTVNNSFNYQVYHRQRVSNHYQERFLLIITQRKNFTCYGYNYLPFWCEDHFDRYRYVCNVIHLYTLNLHCLCSAISVIRNIWMYRHWEIESPRKNPLLWGHDPLWRWASR